MNQKRKISHITSSFMVPFILFICSILMVFLGIIPGIKTINNNYTEIKSLNEQNKALSEKLKILRLYDEATLLGYTQTLLSAVPQEKSLPTVISLIEQTVSQSQVNIDGISINNPGNIASMSAKIDNLNAAKLGSNIIGVVINVVGKIENTKNFLDLINKVRRLARVSNIQASFTKEKEDIIVRSQLTLETFYSPLPTSLGKNTAMVKQLTSEEEDFIAKLNGFQLMIYGLTEENPEQNLNYGRIDPFTP